MLKIIFKKFSMMFLPNNKSSRRKPEGRRHLKSVNGNSDENYV